MKKKISILICLLVCCFSFAFVGCSALDENDKALLNNAYDKMNEFVDDQAQTNADLLEKLEAEQQANSELLEKIDELTEELAKAGDDSELLNKIKELTNEVANLKEEKEYSQEEIKTLLAENLISSMNNAENFLMTQTQSIYKDGKLQSYATGNAGYVYNAETNNFKAVSGQTTNDSPYGYFVDGVYNEQTKTYDETYYDLTTGKEKDSDLAITLKASYTLSNVLTSLYDMTIGAVTSDSAVVSVYDYVTYEMNVLSENKIEFKASSIYKYLNTSNGNFAMDISIVFEDGKVVFAETIQSTISDGSDLCYYKTTTTMNIEYVTDLVMEDYLLIAE